MRHVWCPVTGVALVIVVVGRGEIPKERVGTLPLRIRLELYLNPSGVGCGWPVFLNLDLNRGLLSPRLILERWRGLRNRWRSHGQASRGIGWARWHRTEIRREAGPRPLRSGAQEARLVQGRWSGCALLRIGVHAADAFSNNGSEDGGEIALWSGIGLRRVERVLVGHARVESWCNRV